MEEHEVKVVGIAELATALSLAQAEMKSAIKNKINPYFKSKYADLDSVWDTCRIPLTKNGLSVVQFADSQDNKVTVTTLLLHKSGESLKSTLTIKAKDDSPQAIGSALMYARRYGLSAMAGISADDDDDANFAQASIQEKNKEENPDTINKSQLAAIRSIAIKYGWSDEDLLFKLETLCNLKFDNVSALKDMSLKNAKDIIIKLQDVKPKKENENEV